MEFYAGCRNPKIEDSQFCIYCQAVDYMTNCAGFNRNACRDDFSEKYPPESTSFETKYSHQFVMRYCSSCTFKIECEKGNIQLDEDINQLEEGIFDA
jgi:hypothetical protein